MREQAETSISVSSELQTILEDLKKSPVASTKKGKTLIKMLSYAVSSVLQAVNTTGNNLLFDTLGYPSVSSAITAVQGMARNVLGGALTVCGRTLGSALGRAERTGDNTEAHEIIKASYALTVILTLLSSAAFASTYWISPRELPKQTAGVLSSYFLWGIIGNFATLGIGTDSSTLFVMKDWKSPLLANIVFRLGAVTLSYLLAITAKLRLPGIYYANGIIAPWMAYLPLELRHQYLIRAKLPKPTIPNQNPDMKWTRQLKKMSWVGFQMGLQKFTEFGNMMAIVFALEKYSDENLTIINAAMQAATVLSLLAQGFGMGGNLLLEELKAKLDGNLKRVNDITIKLNDFNISEVSETVQEIKTELNKILDDTQDLLKEIKSITLKCMASGFIANGVVALGLYLARAPIADVFLPRDISAQNRMLSETTLWIAGLGFLFDSSRIISGNLLIPWGVFLLLFTNIVSVVLMTLLGVPAGYFAAKKDAVNAVIYMFAIRSATILLAASINTYMLHQSIKADNKKINDARDAVGLYFFPSATPLDARLLNDNEENIMPRQSPACA